jgi:tetratricopeptide (TPR) repeat protein
MYPDHLEAYDDAGVACDRLGRGDEAIEWMEKKRKQLDTADANDPKIRDHRYRYLANIGTFWAHRWFRAGADRSKISEMETARDYIKKAIELNPNAHFGREKYQLMVMEWVISGPKVEQKGVFDLPDFLGLNFSHGPTKQYTQTELDDAIQGLSGLIVLGDAWNSVDVFLALALALDRREKSGPAYLAYLRCQELIDQGRKSIVAGAGTGEELKKRLPRIPFFRKREEQELNEFRQSYRTLRDEADRWQAKRTDYMTERLTQGSHPDTDSAFWSGYVDPGPPKIAEPILPRGRSGIVAIIGGLTLTVLLFGFLLWKVLRRVRAKAV